MGRPNGQSMVLLVLTLFLLTLMVLMTISFGATAARRTDLNNVADVAALSQATATARTFNTASTLNRTMVSHYVVMAGIQAQVAYASAGHNYFNLAANQVRMLDIASAGPVTTQMSFAGTYPNLGCARRTREVNDASYELWHAALSWYARGAAPDNVNGGCVGGTCSNPRSWIAESLGTLEAAAGDQARAVHQAAWDLARIERATYDELSRRINRGDFLRRTAAAANLSGVQPAGIAEANEELRGATRQSPTFSHPFAEAVMGTRRYERLLVPKDSAGQQPEQLTPLTRRLKREVDAAFAAYPGGQKFWVQFVSGDTSADYSLEPDFNMRTSEDPLFTVGLWLTPRMRFAFGRYQNDPGAVLVRYLDSCAGGIPRTIISGTAGSDGLRAYDALPMGVMVRSTANDGLHNNYESSHRDGAHWRLQGGGCHGTHDHYGAVDDQTVHRLSGEVLPGDALGLAFPDQGGVANEKGAGGLWGQPVLPVIATRQVNPASDPFNLAPFFFRFARTSTSTPTPFDMQSPIDQLTAVSAATVYYHRRQHLGEPPNMLNPFWRATLVPIELDDRGRRPNGGFADPTAASRDTGPDTLETVLQSDLPGYQNRAEALTAYRQLKNEIDGLARTPAPEPP